MTKLLEKALEAASCLRTATMKSRAPCSIWLATKGPEEIDPAHLPDVLESLAQTKRREFATDADVEAVFNR